MTKTIKVNLSVSTAILLAVCICCKKAKSETISFYDVPLVCSAAPEIGCGSRAKPVLLEMEKSPSIREAWLNRGGTVYAVVWADGDKTNEIAKPIFEKYKIAFKKLNGRVAKKLSSGFRETGQWYRGAEVDKLSIEEAGIIANDVVTYALSDRLLYEWEANAVKVEIENHLKTELLKIRTVEELYGNTAIKKFRNDLSDAVVKIIEKDRANKIIELYLHKKYFGKKEGKSCCEKKTEQDVSCKKNKL